MIIEKQKVKEISLDFFERYRSTAPNLFWDKEHYKLLTYLTYKFNNIKIIDAGTCTGHSCLALAQNKTNSIFTYDINPFNDTSIKSMDNVSFFQKDILKEDISILLDTAIILLDIDPHDGIQERRFTDLLSSIGYKGILICDDIFLNKGMKDWWNSLSNTLDLTDIGHGTGTGLVNYSNEKIIVQ